MLWMSDVPAVQIYFGLDDAIKIYNKIYGSQIPMTQGLFCTPLMDKDVSSFKYN